VIHRPLAVLVAVLVAASARPSSAADATSLGIPTIHVFGLDEGLPQTTINAIVEDRGGRMWIGTQGGAAYHDGQHFTALPIPTGGSSRWVQTIAAAQDGSVWFGMVDGSAFRYAGGSFQRFGAAEGLTSARPIRAMLETHRPGGTTVWAGTMDGLYRFENGRFHPASLEPGFEHLDIHTLLEGTLPSGEPTLWVGAASGLFHCEQERCAPSTALTAKGIGALLQTTGAGGRSELWVGTSGGVIRYADGRWQSALPAS